MKRLILVLVFLILSGVAYACAEKVTICHCEPQKKCITLSIPESAARAHLREHEDDYRGECEEPEPTPTPTPTPTPIPEPTPKPKEPEEPKGFSEDTRCHDTTPPKITWINITDGSDANDWHPYATWSAQGGDTIEVRFGPEGAGFPWRFEMLNDGHESLGFVHNTGILGYLTYCYEFRTVNGCKDGPWSETVCAFN